MNIIDKTKLFVHEKKEPLIVLAVSATAGLIGSYVAVKTYQFTTRNDVLIPAKVIEHLKQNGGAVAGHNVVKGFDIVVKLESVVKS